MEIRIEATRLPGNSCGPSPERPGGHTGIHVGVQRTRQTDELLHPVRADARSASWTLPCTITDDPSGPDVRGPYVGGSRGGRFVFLSWVTVDDEQTPSMFRRAKLCLDAVSPEVLADAATKCALVGRLDLADPKGNPLCGPVQTPIITWTAAIA
jgi:hypothetical protein